MQRELLRQLLEQNKQSCNYAFEMVTPLTAVYRLNNKAASVGFIYRHVGETLNLFGFFLGKPTEVKNTTMGATDQGQGADAGQSRALVAEGYAMLDSLVEEQADAWWFDLVDTPFFGNIPRIRLFAHTLYHNSHHAGQIALSLSRGNPGEARGS